LSAPVIERRGGGAKFPENREFCRSFRDAARNPRKTAALARFSLLEQGISRAYQGISGGKLRQPGLTQYNHWLLG
jgi:hypothetical protein